MILRWASACTISRQIKFNSLLSTKNLRTCTCYRTIQQNSISTIKYRDHEDFGKLGTIYRNPYIASLKFVISLKYSLLPFYVILIFAELGAYYRELITVPDIILINFGKLVFTYKILLLKKKLTNTIGFIYTTEDDSLVVSYMDAYGERIDEKFSKNQLKLSYIDEKKFYAKYVNKAFVTLTCQETNRKFNLHLTKADMFEEEMINHFGALPETAFY